MTPKVTPELSATLVAAQPSKTTSSEVASVVTRIVGTLGVGAGAEISIEVQVGGPDFEGMLASAAGARADHSDSTPIDNLAADETPVKPLVLADGDESGNPTNRSP